MSSDLMSEPVAHLEVVDPGDVLEDEGDGELGLELEAIELITHL